MKTNDPFYLLLEKVFIENQFYRQIWYEGAKSHDELREIVKQNLTLHLNCLQRSITDEDVEDLMKTKNSYIAHYDSARIIKMLNAKKKFLPFSIKASSTGIVKEYDLTKLSNLACSNSREIITSLVRDKSPYELKLVIMCSESEMENYGVFLSIETQYLAIMRGGEYGPSLVSKCSTVVNMLNSLMCETQQRLDWLARGNFFSIEDYNAFVANEKYLIPYIVVIMDDFADFITQAGRYIETPLFHLAQKAHRAGIHFLLSTKHPTNDVLTGVIKSVIPKYLRIESTMSGADIKDILSNVSNRTFSHEQYTLPQCEIKHIKSKI